MCQRAVRSVCIGKAISVANTRLLSLRKKKERLKPLGCCAYCGRSQDKHGKPLALTSEHIIAEALGCGIELPEASCSDCQRVTSEFERSVTEEMFDPVRRIFALKGKGGILQKQNFPVDVGTTVTNFVMLVEQHHPTLLTLPQLYPACVRWWRK